MQVSTGLFWPEGQVPRSIPDHDLVMVTGTYDQITELSRHVRGGVASEAKKAARRTQQRSRRANRG